MGTYTSTHTGAEIDAGINLGTLSGENFIAPDTVITVGATGADYTTLEGALGFLAGKWSSGTVTIAVTSGTYVITDSITLDNYANSINIIKIIGDSENIPVISFPTVAANGKALIYSTDKFNTLYIFENLKLQGNSNYGRGFGMVNDMVLKNVSFQNLNCAVFMSYGSNAIIGNVTAIDVTTPFQADTASSISFRYMTSIVCTNATTGMKALANGAISLSLSSPTFTNVTTQYSPALNTLGTAGGYIAS